MEEIKIMEKPEWISWDDIHELLLAAHKKNIEKGILFRNVQMSGDEIGEKIGEEGCCWVALCGDKLVGTTSVKYYQGKSWWNHGKKVAHGCFTGILKDYQGIGIREDFDEKFREHIKRMGADIVDGNTAETNYVVLKIARKNGCKFVSYYAESRFNSIQFAKWLKGCPYSDKYIEMRFFISKMLTKIQYKPGKVERSHIITLFCEALQKINRKCKDIKSNK